MRDLKEAYPIEITEYTIANKLEQEPAFTWRVPFVLKKRNQRIAAAKSKRQKKFSKFGIEVPYNVERALVIDLETKTNYWSKAIEKKMIHVTAAFQILDQGESAPIASKFIKCHMHFEIKSDLN